MTRQDTERQGQLLSPAVVHSRDAKNTSFKSKDVLKECVMPREVGVVLTFSWFTIVWPGFLSFLGSSSSAGPGPGSGCVMLSYHRLAYLEFFCVCAS